MSSFKIRRALPSDIEMLSAISRDTFKETFSAMNSQKNMRQYLDQNMNNSKVLEELHNHESLFFVAESETSQAGYLKVNLGAAQTVSGNDNGLEIERIYVLGNHQDQGIGKDLLNKAKEIASQNKCRYIWLGVWEHNSKAINFYEKNGFQTFGKHDFVLGDDRQTDILMRLDL